MSKDTKDTKNIKSKDLLIEAYLPGENESPDYSAAIKALTSLAIAQAKAYSASSPSIRDTLEYNSTMRSIALAIDALEALEDSSSQDGV